MTTTLLAGASTVDITPPVGGLMDGYGGRLTPSTGVHDPLFARVLVLDYGEDGACAIVGCDLLGMHPWIAGEVRRRAEASCGIAPDAVIVAATHNHAGPVNLRAGIFSQLDEAAAASLAERIGSAIEAAWAQRRPATLSVGAAEIDTISMNRRDSSAASDSTLRVVVADGEDGPIAALLNFPCHATVLDGTNLQLSAEFPGVACRIVEQATGAGAVYLNGACGDVNPAWIAQDFASVERAGQVVGGQAVRLIGELQAAATGQRAHNIRWDEFTEVALPGRVVRPRLRYSRREIDLPLRQFLDDAEYARLIEKAQGGTGREAAARLSRFGAERWAAVWARREGSEGTKGTKRTEVQAVSLGGGLAALALPGEFFGETAEAVRAEAAAPDLLVACYANDYVGYVIPEAAYEGGGYEVGITPFAPEAEALVRQTAVELLGLVL
jgi:hypothetical protein